MSCLGPFLRYEQVAVLAAEVWHVDCGQRIGRLDGHQGAGRQLGHFPAGLENRKRAFQPAKVDRDGSAGQRRYQIFQNGFSLTALSLV